MAIVDTSTPHTLIVRWDDYGKVCEAQFYRLRHVEIDDEVIKHEVIGPAILNHTDLANEPDIATVNTEALARVNELTAELAEARSALETALKNIEELTERLEERKEDQ